MAKLFQNAFNWIAKKFADNPPKMIITTSVIGWGLSSLAQILAVAVNPRIKEEQKLFLIPQEFNDALVNIGAFLCITLLTKNTVANLFKTGKFAPKCVREYLNKNAKMYKNSIGKLDFNLEEVLKNSDIKTQKAFKTYKTFGTTVATVGAGILATNVVTPIIRNKMASAVQKSYIDGQRNPVTAAEITPQTNAEKKTEVHSVPKPQLGTLSSKGAMRI